MNVALGLLGPGSGGVFWNRWEGPEERGLGSSRCSLTSPGQVGPAPWLAPSSRARGAGREVRVPIQTKAACAAPRPTLWARRPRVPAVFNSKTTLLRSLPGWGYLRICKTVPEIKWHLPPFKKGDSGADSGFRCPLGWPRAWRVRGSAWDVQEEGGKGRSPVGSSALRKFLKACLTHPPVYPIPGPVASLQFPP